MKRIILIMLLIIPNFVFAEEICSLYENKIEPDHQWKDSDFTAEKAKEAVAELGKIVNGNKGYAWNEITILNTLIEGYILKRSALKEIKTDGKADEPYYGFHQSAYCAWLTSTPIID